MVLRDNEVVEAAKPPEDYERDNYQAEDECVEYVDSVASLNSAEEQIDSKPAASEKCCGYSVEAENRLKIAKYDSLIQPWCMKNGKVVRIVVKQKKMVPVGTSTPRKRSKCKRGCASSSSSSCSSSSESSSCSDSDCEGLRNVMIPYIPTISDSSESESERELDVISDSSSSDSEDEAPKHSRKIPHKCSAPMCCKICIKAAAELRESYPSPTPKSEIPSPGAAPEVHREYRERPIGYSEWGKLYYSNVSDPWTNAKTPAEAKSLEILEMLRKMSRPRY